MQYNIICSASFLQGIIIFIIVGCRQMKILEKMLDLEFLTNKEHKVELLRGVFLTKPLLKCSSSVNLVKILEKIHLTEFIFSSKLAIIQRSFEFAWAQLLLLLYIYNIYLSCSVSKLFKSQKWFRFERFQY